MRRDKGQGLVDQGHPAGVRRPRKSLQARLQEIIDQERELESRCRELLALQRAEAMIGAACRADDTIREFLQAVLDKHFTYEKNRAFLRAEGWL